MLSFCNISVGKRSSALKLKPTPPYEITSIKRARVARTSALKRKVLMDETMVLHGEYVSFSMMVIFMIITSPNVHNYNYQISS